MSETLKILGQNAPVAATPGDIDTVGADKTHIISTLTICNTNAAVAKIRVHARIAGAAIAVGNAILYDASIKANETITLTLGLTLAEDDVLSTRSDIGAVTFTAFGSELA